MIRSTSGRCVVVDLDDTLYDEIDFVRSGYAAVALEVRERYSLDCSAQLERCLADRRFDRAFDDVIAAAGLPSDALPWMVDIYRSHRPTIRPTEDALALVRSAKRRDGVVGCITDGRGVTQRNKVDALGLCGVLVPLLVSEETGHTKPDPHNFIEMMRLVEATDYWYIADNPIKDFIAPNSLGWTTVGVNAPSAIHRHDASSLPASCLPHHQLSLGEARALLSR